MARCPLNVMDYQSSYEVKDLLFISEGQRRP